MVIDKTIHKDEFRCRILLTNACNKSCKNCLNDFQKSKKPTIMLDEFLAKRIISDYEDKVIGTITLSGGEIGLHPGVFNIVKHVKASRLVAVTNGTLLNRPEWEEMKEFIDEVHIGITSLPTERMLYFLRNYTGKVVFQYVVGMDYDYEFLRTLAYGELYTVKLFEDFYAPQSFDLEYANVVHKLAEEFPDVDIKGRFTGVQENRGQGCNGCGRRCVTLKGMWVFPNGQVSPCPQREEFFEDFSEDSIQRFIEFHKWIG